MGPCGNSCGGCQRDHNGLELCDWPRRPRRMMAVIYVLLVLLFAILPAGAYELTYHVATTGNNTNTCNQAQNINTPKQTIASEVGYFSSQSS